MFIYWIISQYKGGNPTNQYLVEDDGIYEDDTYQEYQEYEEEEEMDYDFQHQDYYEDDAYETDPYDDNSNMYDEDTYRSHFSEEERYWAGTVIIYAFSLSRSCRKCSGNNAPYKWKKPSITDSQSQLLTLNLIPWKTRCKYSDFMLYSILLRHKTSMI